MIGCSLADLHADRVCHTVMGDAATVVHGVKHDSRRIEPGDLFVAIDGVQQEGAHFIDDAVRRGAVAVLAARAVSASVPVCVADDAALALAAVAHRVYARPTDQLRVVGITGTNGKTTTAGLIEQMLQRSGVSVALCGTVVLRTPKSERSASLTTPMADDLVRFARQAVDDGAESLVMEVSSHALSMQRVAGVRFTVTAFTNLSQDHLDYHGDMASYEQAKTLLFTEYASRTSVINVDDAAGARIASKARSERVWRCSTQPDSAAEVVATEWQSTARGLQAQVRTPAGIVSLRSPLIGKHNLENLLVAVAVCLALDVPLPQIESAAAECTGAPGRLEVVADDRGVLVLVDYAHTPDALARVIEAVRPLTNGRLWVVFGCGGDRDAAKRPLMGAAVGARADIAIVTSDNPRSESPLSIIEQIEPGLRAAGMSRWSDTASEPANHFYRVEPDRRVAIVQAVAAARAGDTVLIAGKGHETTQTIGSDRFEFDDRIEAARAIAAVGRGV